MRLTDVDILMETLGISMSCEDCAWKGNAFCRRGADFENACWAIRNASTIELERPERESIKWIPHKSIFGGLGERVYTCNKCGHNIGFHIENFCPNCGGKYEG